MSSPSRVLAPIVTGAVHAAFGDGFRDEDPVLRPSQFADVQANAALALAKRVGLAPREVAARVAEHLDLVGVCSSAEVSGPGFINFMLDDAWIADQASEMVAEGRLGVPQLPAECIPVDYSAPNVAKEMHVGHLRTTVVGDALVRVLEHLGHRVVRQNHIGDWGTPFGMLIEHLLDVGEGSEDARLVTTDQCRRDTGGPHISRRSRGAGARAGANPLRGRCPGGRDDTRTPPALHLPHRGGSVVLVLL